MKQALIAFFLLQLYSTKNGCEAFLEDNTDFKGDCDNSYLKLDWTTFYTLKNEGASLLLVVKSAISKDDDFLPQQDNFKEISKGSCGDKGEFCSLVHMDNYYTFDDLTQMGVYVKVHNILFEMLKKLKILAIMNINVKSFDFKSVLIRKDLKDVFFLDAFVTSSLIDSSINHNVNLAQILAIAETMNEYINNLLTEKMIKPLHRDVMDSYTLFYEFIYILRPQSFKVDDLILKLEPIVKLNDKMVLIKLDKRDKPESMIRPREISNEVVEGKDDQWTLYDSIQLGVIILVSVTTFVMIGIAFYSNKRDEANQTETRLYN